MENQTENLVFFTKCKEAINSSFIMFETKLEDLLYSLAESPIVYSIVEKCLKDYDYFSERGKCLVNPTPNSKGGFYPPSDRRDFIALAFNILYEVYEKKMPFTDLVDLYFDGNGYKEKFELFKEKLLVRLYKDMYSVVEDLQVMYEANSTQEKQIIEEKIDKISQLKLFINEQKIKLEDKEYLNYFIDAIVLGKDREVCLKAIGYILSNYKKGDEIYNEILECLQ